MDRRLLLVLAWAACAVLAAGLGFGAASLVGDAIGDTPSASADQTSTTTTTATPATGTPTATASTGRTATGATTRPSTRTATPSHHASASTDKSGSRSTSGGVVYATCRGGLARVSPSPAAGWRVDSYTRGFVSSAQAEFVNGTTKVEVKASCGSSGPVFAVETGSDRSGGDDGGGSGGGSGTDSSGGGSSGG